LILQKIDETFQSRIKHLSGGVSTKESMKKPLTLRKTRRLGSLQLFSKFSRRTKFHFNVESFGRFEKLDF
jgi:hypothetical protein